MFIIVQLSVKKTKPTESRDSRRRRKKIGYQRMSLDLLSDFVQIQRGLRILSSGFRLMVAKE